MHFWPKNGNGNGNGLPSSRMGTDLKTKGIQSYLRIWGGYDPIELGPSETRKGGLYGGSVKKSCHDGNNNIGGFAQQNDFGPKTALLGPKRATLGNRGHETARRAAKRPPTGKPKLSRVTSECGDVMIP